MHFLHGAWDYVRNKYSLHKTEEGMQKLIGAALLLVILAALNTKAFAISSLDCKIKSGQVAGIKTLYINEDALIINDQVVVELAHSKIKCGNLGRQDRFDGDTGEGGIQVVLKSCTNGSVLEGHIIDSRHAQVADIVCD
jgi:hypothetical protein